MNIPIIIRQPDIVNILTTSISSLSKYFFIKSPKNTLTRKNGTKILYWPKLPPIYKILSIIKKKIAKKIEKIIERIGIKKYITINHNVILETLDK